jgi:hypothetical protein
MYGERGRESTIEENVKRKHSTGILRLRDSIALGRSANCNRNQSATQDSQPLLSNLKESYGYTSDWEEEGFRWPSTSKCQFATDKETWDIL